MTTKITDANLDSNSLDNTNFNIGLLGFKMAVNEGLTVFNLVDGVVDEFNDESGTDEAEGTNDVYCASSDFYQNVTLSPICYSAGFTSTTVTEPDTSTAGAINGAGYTQGGYTVPVGISSVNFYMWGAGGAGDNNACGPDQGPGGGGGFSTGTLAVTPGQVLYTGGSRGGSGVGEGFGQAPQAGGRQGGHLVSLNSTSLSVSSGETTAPAPSIFAIAGSGGGGSYGDSHGGAGGGAGGHQGRSQSANTAKSPTNYSGGGGDQEQGGQGGTGCTPGGTGQFLEGGTGGNSNAGNGGAGYYGGGGGASGAGEDGSGGGGSGYISHPQITCGTTQAGAACAVGGQGSPLFPSLPGPSYGGGGAIQAAGEPGYVLLTASGVSTTPGGSTTIVSTAFTSTSVPTNSRIVVFEEDVETPTLNTDIIASVSRDGGTTFTNATLSDSGYVTGSSGQRILTGQADISGQPSGQSMRWKLALANNTVKIHGVSLQWS